MLVENLYDTSPPILSSREYAYYGTASFLEQLYSSTHIKLKLVNVVKFIGDSNSFETKV